MALLCLSMMTFVGCGNKDDKNAATDSPASEATTAPNDDDSVLDDAEDGVDDALDDTEDAVDDTVGDTEGAMDDSTGNGTNGTGTTGNGTTGGDTDADGQNNNSVTDGKNATSAAPTAK